MHATHPTAVCLLLTLLFFTYIQALEKPCSYCTYCDYCPLCDQCPCSDKEHCTMCKYCDYCKYCSMCKMCDMGQGLVSMFSGFGGGLGGGSSTLDEDLKNINTEQLKEELRKAKSKKDEL